MGRGEYSDYLVVYQKCGIGANHDIYPTLRKNVTLRPGASIIGNCKVGENCEIGAESLLMDKNLEIGCVTPKIINSDGSLQISCKRSLPKIRNSIYKICSINILMGCHKTANNL